MFHPLIGCRSISPVRCHNSPSPLRHLYDGHRFLCRRPRTQALRASYTRARMSSTMHIWQQRSSNLEFIHDGGVRYRLSLELSWLSCEKCQNTTDLGAPDHPVEEEIRKHAQSQIDSRGSELKTQLFLAPRLTERRSEKMKLRDGKRGET